MQRARVAVVEAFIGGFDGVDVADEIRDAHIWGGQLFDVTVAAVQPLNGGLVTAGLEDGPALRRDRRHRVLGKWRARQHRNPFVQQIRQAARNPRLGLAAQAEQIHAVPGEQGALHIGQHRVVISDDALKQRPPGLDAVHEVGPDFRGNGAGRVAGGAQGAKGLEVWR